MQDEHVEWVPAEYLKDLQGVIDTHYHSAPDFCERLESDIQVARSAKAAGMAGIVLKGHITSTSDRAKLAREAVPGAPVFGGIALNTPVGGLNPDAVELCLRQGGKIVWGPTMWAQNHIDYIRRSAMAGYKAIGMRFPEVGITLCDERGDLKPEAIDICRLIAKYDACLSTGHVTLEEQQKWVDVALEVGVKRIIITHPNYQVTYIPMEEQKKFVAKGCMIEYCYVCMTPQWQTLDPVRGWAPRRIAEAIKELGAEHCLISSDLGQVHNPPMVEGMRQFIRLMREEGLDDREIDLVTRKNPAFVLGL